MLPTPGEHRLVHEQAADRRPAEERTRRTNVGVGVAAQRVGPEPGEDRVAPSCGPTRSHAVGPRRSAYQRLALAAAARTAPARRRARAPWPAAGAVEAEVHVHAPGRPRSSRRGACRRPRPARGRRRSRMLRRRTSNRPCGLRRRDRPDRRRSGAARGEPVQRCGPRAPASLLEFGLRSGRMAREKRAPADGDEHPDDRALDRLADRGPSRVGVDGARGRATCRARAAGQIAAAGRGP